MAVGNGLPDRKTQTVALIRKQGGQVEIVDDYPIPSPGANEVLVKILYTGVCQSDLHTARGSSAGPDGKAITAIKLPHIGGHEGVGRIIALGEEVTPIDNDISVGGLVGIRFPAKVCYRCENCRAGLDQHCPRMRSHLHHRDGSFQEYTVLDADYLTLLPTESDPISVAPTLCAGVTAYKGVLNTNIKAGQFLAVVGAAGGLGHFAVQYARAMGAIVIAVDAGAAKESFVRSIGAQHYIDIAVTPDAVDEVRKLTDGLGVHAVVVTAGSDKAYAAAGDMLRIGGTLSCCGIPVDGGHIGTPISRIIIRGLRVVGNLVGTHKEVMDAVEFVNRGIVKPKVEVREFQELENIYNQLEKGEILGRVVLKVARDE